MYDIFIHNIHTTYIIHNMLALKLASLLACSLVTHWIAVGRPLEIRWVTGIDPLGTRDGWNEGIP